MTSFERADFQNGKKDERRESDQSRNRVRKGRSSPSTVILKISLSTK